MNKAFFTDIKIENFKSLRSVELTDCNRINVFIGKPNVGKSNILEALSMFSKPDSSGINGLKNITNIKKVIRVDGETELFFDGEESNPISLTTNLGTIEMTNSFADGLDVKYSEEMVKSLNRTKKYIFKSQGIQLNTHGSVNDSLMSPFGENLLNIIQTHPKLNRICRKLFEEYNLQLLFDKRNRSMMITKPSKVVGDEMPAIFTMPYGSVADTLQRIIFYKTAIASNTDAVLLFEEPEAHSFPPYIRDITQDILAAKSNQFFITTHSPFVLNDFLENGRDELAVFVVGWENGETIVKKLTPEQVYDVYQCGVDLFTNIETYI
jgi:AAA15 family ATPase/GTPase